MNDGNSDQQSNEGSVNQPKRDDPSSKKRLEYFFCLMERTPAGNSGFLCKVVREELYVDKRYYIDIIIVKRWEFE